MDADEVRRLIRQETRFRTGLGFDVHRLAPGRRLVLGGVEIPHNLGLEGHSDADVLTHAIMDALLGAAGLADIGVHFPNTDPRWKDASSLGMARSVAAMVRQRGYDIESVDAMVLAERPRLAPHFPLMRGRLAEALGLDPEAIGLKATTTEGLGFPGRGEGMAALACALLRGPRP
ncbi:MAG TPA: 2-C-methyl-D-erythritol 2,4-cyclodiphosphate synthase [Candidatus Nitrosotenuis sp.]|jgi:2-C-methyl-D-erythritol 2,4-cyclodiphosphate synthase|nr:2-C-methyl-D-erythritol 2,4-cyclodiphosphate synthase [Candidatus Nitrosotenuis sp.]